MAVTTYSVVFSGTATNTFTFPTPSGNYSKIASVSLTSPAGQPVTVCFAAPDVSSAGTTTATIILSDTFTGTVEVIVIDRP